MKLTGTWCERGGNFVKEHFDPRSFRWKASGKARILVGCPRGEWLPRAKHCKVGTQAYKILTPVHRSTGCGPHGRRGRKIKKG